MAQSKQQSLPNTQNADTLTGSGGRENNPDAASPSAEKTRNSSGAASPAAAQLELRQRVLAIEECLLRVAESLGDRDMTESILRRRQRGFRGQK